MEIILGIIVGLLALMLLVVGHEFGHFIAARRNGVEVEEFAVCFPPRIAAWRKVNGKMRRLKKSEWDNAPGKGTILSLNWLPIGGFCQMKGESASDKRKGTFGAASFWAKTKILFGGVAMNWLISIVLLTIAAWVGMPHFLPNQFTIAKDTHVVVEEPVGLAKILPNTPADDAGLKAGEFIEGVSAGSEPTSSVLAKEDLLKFNSEHAGEQVYYTVRQSNDIVKTVAVKLNDAGEAPLLGAEISGAAVYRSGWSAPLVGVGLTAQITGETFAGVGRLLVDVFGGAFSFLIPNGEIHEQAKAALAEAGNSVSGPIGIVGVMVPAFMQMGLSSLLFLVAMISVSLAVMNVLPIPALDGGRWLLIAYYKLRNKELSKEKEERIVSRAFSVILVIALIVTILDLMRIFA